MMDGLVVDSFAGGGGVSLGIERALNRPVDIAINHDPEAIAMHRANHPQTLHYDRNIWDIPPTDATNGKRIALAWFSPDCQGFSKAKGGRPVKRHVRDLAWVVVRWAKRVRPRVIFLENVEEFRTWGPLTADNLPCRKRKGQTFEHWIRELRRLGYEVEWRELRACDYGAPTIRKRLYLVARCDGEPIAWPEQTHGPELLAYRTAAQCIDWSIPCPSIFLTKEQGRAIGAKRPLADATMRRIARGIVRYVLETAEPFIIPVTHKGDLRSHRAGEPLRTITTAPRGEQALVAPFFTSRYGERHGQEPRCRTVEYPLQTITPTMNGASLVAAFLAQHNSGMVGHDTREPLSIIVQRGCTQGVIAAHLSRQFGNSVGQAADAPAPTVTAGGGGKTSLVVAHLSHQYTSNTNGGDGRLDQPHRAVLTAGHHALIAAFLTKYYGDGAQWQTIDEPSHTIPTRGRMGLVSVTIGGVDTVMTDIGMRILTPRELFRAQGFPDSYRIDPQFRGKPLTKTAQIRLCGNSVCPQVAEAIVRANLGERSFATPSRIAA